VAGLVQADAARLPFPSGSCPLVVSAFTHTDVEDFTSLAGEAGRVLEPDGRFVYVGPGSVPGGLTSRVGFRHLPIARLLNGVLEAGFRLCRVEEAGMSRLPEWLALVGRR
jgi:SAM-dependent methyltransferase